MTNEFNDENINKIKNTTEICNESNCNNDCRTCVQLYLKSLLNKVK